MARARRAAHQGRERLDHADDGRDGGGAAAGATPVRRPGADTPDVARASLRRGHRSRPVDDGRELACGLFTARVAAAANFHKERRRPTIHVVR
eukprot:7387246-Prymnesium_polylepis.2